MFVARLLIRVAALGIAIIALAQCRPAPESRGDSPQRYSVTIAPLGAYLSPIVAGRGDIHVLLPPGASPHTYEITPADARAAASARALVYVDASLDAWAARLDSPAHVRLAECFPPDTLRYFEETAHGDHVHDEGTLDPHMWLDPNLMRAGLLRTIAALSELDPEGAATYRANGEAFSIELTRLDEELTAMLAPIKGQGVIQFHPAFHYFFERYGIRTAGVIETIAGQEPSPKDIKQLADRMAAENVTVIVTEPQLPDAPVRALAEATGARIARMDPLGGVPGRMTYAELLRYNANALLEAFP